jgi:hypothetical protein
MLIRILEEWFPHLLIAAVVVASVAGVVGVAVLI